MSTSQSDTPEVKPILPKKPLLPRANGGQDRLAWALKRGWLKPSNRHLTIFVIETRKGLPMKIRIRDWILMTLAWGAWILLLLDVAINNPEEAGQLIGPGYWSPDLVQELLFSLIVVTSLVLLLTLFGVHSLYRFRNPIKIIQEPLPLNTEEQAKCCGLSVSTMKDWRMAREIKVEIDEEGLMKSYEIFPQGPPESLII